jgi:hypothetical protein
MGEFAWQVQKKIDWIESVNRGIEKAAKAGKILRHPDGRRGYWKTTRPTQEQMDQAKANLLPYVESEASYCPCCDTHFLLPSAYSSIEEHGVCQGCYFFAHQKPILGGPQKGQIPKGVYVKRAPTVEEALAVPVDKLGSSEIWVIRNELIKTREKSA